MDAGELKARMEAEKKAKDEALKRKAQADGLAGVRRASSATEEPTPRPTSGDLRKARSPMGGLLKKPGLQSSSTESVSAQLPKFIAEYTVKKGDTLSQIAKNFYGVTGPKYWNLIQAANKDLIKDVNLIFPGQVFKIPELPEELKKK